MGAVVAFPEDFFDAIATKKAKHPVLFRQIAKVVSEEQDSKGMAVAGTTFTNLVAGTVDSNTTTAIRQALRDFNMRHFPQTTPPIGIYAAGSFCQMLTVPSFKFETNMRSFAKVFEAAGWNSDMQPSQYLLALAGVSLLDAELSGVLADASDPRQARVHKEFQITSGAEKELLTKFTKAPEFGETQGSFLSVPNWIRCRQQFFFWAEHNESMVD